MDSQLRDLDERGHISLQRDSNERVVSATFYRSFFDGADKPSLEEVFRLNPQIEELTLLLKHTTPSSAAFDLEILERLPRLSFLKIYGSKPLKNVDALARLSNLRTLCLRGCVDCSNVDLSGSSVKTLRLSEAPSISLDHLPRDLKQLTVSSSNLDSVIVRGLPKLRELVVIDNATRELKLENLPSLISLEVIGIPIQSLELFAGLNLSNLVVSESRLTDLRGLSNFPSLKKLDVSRSGIADVEPISRFTEMQAINLSYTEVSDLRPLMKLRELSDLSLSGCKQISDFSFLSGIAKLQLLEVARTQFTDLASLQLHADRITHLDISRTRVTDVQPLLGFRKLDVLFAASLSVVSLEPVNVLRKTVKNCHVRGTEVR